MTGLGDRRPSEVMDEMLALFGDHPPCFLFEELFKRQLPPDLRMQLATADFSDPRGLARNADALWGSRPKPVVAATAAARSPTLSKKRVDPPQASQRLQQQPGSLCWYHQKFGKDARKCLAPCSLQIQGNGITGRQ